MLRIDGQDKLEIIRIETGLYSFDRAFADQTEIGLPLGLIELFGPTAVGKTISAMSLAFLLAGKLNTNIAWTAFEKPNLKVVKAIAEQYRFSGELFHSYDDKEGKDEVTLDKFLDKLRTKDCHIGILDAIASISPVAEQEGDLGDANMGQRARLMAQFTRKAESILRNDPHKVIFMLNHEYDPLGMSHAKVTPGGTVKNYKGSLQTTRWPAEWLPGRSRRLHSPWCPPATVKLRAVSTLNAR